MESRPLKEYLEVDVDERAVGARYMLHLSRKLGVTCCRAYLISLFARSVSLECC